MIIFTSCLSWLDSGVGRSNYGTGSKGPPIVDDEDRLLVREAVTMAA